MQWLFLPLGGLLSGILSGLFGIGGACLTIPLMLALGAEPIQATATSNLAIVVVTLSGSWQNWQMGFLKFKKVFYLALPALATAQMGVCLAHQFPSHILLFCFGVLLSTNFYLIGLKKQLLRQGDPIPDKERRASVMATILGTGSLAGLLAGLLGVSGGVILVPMQILLLGEPIKVAIQTSLAVSVIATLSACVGHAWDGNILWVDGLTLGIGGVLGAAIGTRWLPYLPDAIVTFSFRILLALMSTYIFWRSWLAYATT